MSTWQYRVMRHQWQGGDAYGIDEVYDGKGWTSNPCWPLGDTLEELKSDYRAMARAFKLPVLDYKTGKPIKKGKG